MLNSTVSMKFQLIKAKMLNINVFHVLKLSDVVFILLINVSMPTILTFIIMINTSYENLKARKVFIFSAELGIKFLYNLGPHWIPGLYVFIILISYVCDRYHDHRGWLILC